MSEKAMLKMDEERQMDRKTSKPLMEKRRRARINSSLGQIKTLVLQALKKDPSRYTKLEKADILEMCVHHLRNVQRQQVSAVSTTTANITKYRDGFSKCATETIGYLQSNETMDPEIKQRLAGHLSNCVTTMGVSSASASPQPIVSSTMEQPLSIRIPHMPAAAQPINIHIPNSPQGSNMISQKQQTIAHPLLVAQNQSPNAVNCAYVVLGQANVVSMPQGLSNAVVISPTVGETANNAQLSAFPMFGNLLPSPSNVIHAQQTVLPHPAFTQKLVKCENTSPVDKSPVWRPW